MEELLKVGSITSTHGLRGEVKVYPTTDPERFAYLEHCVIKTKQGEVELAVQGIRSFKNLFILKFKDLDRIEDVEKYKGLDLWVRRDQAQELEEDEYYIADLIGMDVRLEDGTPFGILKDVLETGANDVYLVQRQDGSEVLLPAIQECIRQVDVEGNVMTIHLMKGLVDEP